MQHCFGSGTVVPDLESTDKFDAIRELIRRAAVFREIADLEEFEQAVHRRERIQTTGLGRGVAVAHGRVQGVQRILMAMGMSRKGIAYESPDNEPVQFLFLIASPPHLTVDYLQALSTLVRSVRPRAIRDSLLRADSVQSIQRRLREAVAGVTAGNEDPGAGRRPCETAG